MAIMKSNSNDLLAALSLIREECRFHDGTCSACPLSINAKPDKCGITGRVMHTSDWRDKPKAWKTAEVRLFQPREEANE